MFPLGIPWENPVEPQTLTKKQSGENPSGDGHLIRHLTKHALGMFYISVAIFQDTAFYWMCNECVYYSPSEIMIASDPHYKHKCNSVPL